MTTKSPTQLMLEAQRNEDIQEIIAGSLKKNRGQKNLVMVVALDLGVADVTIYRWCNDLGIDIDEYRRPLQGRSQALAEGNPERKEEREKE